jgi:2-keto-4-pentenoate hydratase/2-oxohepta-3-ene-1,7-dioic acid hydratase in catechol pathway
MKLARWQHRGEINCGVIHDGRAIAFTDGLTIEELVKLGLAETVAICESLIAMGKEGTPGLDEIKLLVPHQPPSIRDYVAFEEHVEGVVKSIDASEGVVAEWYEYPTFYFTNPNSLIATGDVMHPPVSQKLDFELELGIVLGAVDGQDGRNLSIEAAAKTVFGYTIFNDWSARDIQSREMKVRLGPAKGKDFATTLGPWIVTADEFEARVDAEGFMALEMTVAVNGTKIGRDSLASIGWPIPELIAYASRNSRVLPGDVLGSGTVGSGCLAELWGRNGGPTPPPLKPGDEVVMTIEGIGEIRNVVGDYVPAPPIPAARKRPRLPRSYN